MPTRAPSDRSSSRRLGAPTLADVAALAGVSAMTVSRTLRDPAAVRETTRDAVAKAVADLNYTPNSAARTLAGGATLRLGLLCADLGAGFLSKLLVGCLAEANRHHVQVVIENAEPSDDPLTIAATLIDARVDGVLLPPPLGEHAGVIALLADAGVPAVAITASVPDARLGAVHIDDTAAAVAMTRHLIALGHRRIALITGPVSQSAAICRLDGFRTAHRDAGMAIDDALIATGAFTYQSGLDAAERLLALPERPTAIFACNDEMAAATVAVAHRLRLDVPADLTVCGFDDTLLATTIWPQLTTIRQPLAEMSGAAVAMLLDAIRLPDQPAGERDRVFAFELVRRQSDAPPPHPAG